MKLLLSATVKYLAGVFLVGALLFLPAGTFDFAGAWLLMGLLFIPMLLLGLVLFFKSPELLKKRINGKEDESTQKGVVAASGLIFLAGFIVAGLDHRFNWSSVPTSVTSIASVVLLISYGAYAEVMRENAYLSRTIQVCENQKVVDTGLYGIVRHPMYTATLTLFFSFPLILGSLWSLLCFLPYLPVICIRILNEEKVLRKDLAGYEEYQRKVRYRLLPFIW